MLERRLRVLMSGDFRDDRPRKTSKSLIFILTIFFRPAMGGELGPCPPLPVYATSATVRPVFGWGIVYFGIRP